MPDYYNLIVHDDVPPFSQTFSRLFFNFRLLLFSLPCSGDQLLLTRIKCAVKRTRESLPNTHMALSVDYRGACFHDQTPRWFFFSFLLFLYNNNKMEMKEKSFFFRFPPSSVSNSLLTYCLPDEFRFISLIIFSFGLFSSGHLERVNLVWGVMHLRPRWQQPNNP